MLFLSGLAVGSILTMFIMCLCVLSGDESEEERKRDEKYGL